MNLFAGQEQRHRCREQFCDHSGERSQFSQFSISPSNEYSGLSSFRMDWLDLLAVQGTLKSLFQHHSSKASILQLSLQSNSHSLQSNYTQFQVYSTVIHLYIYRISLKQQLCPYLPLQFLRMNLDKLIRLHVSALFIFFQQFFMDMRILINFVSHNLNMCSFKKFQPLRPCITECQRLFLHLLR